MKNVHVKSFIIFDYSFKKQRYFVICFFYDLRWLICHRMNVKKWIGNNVYFYFLFKCLTHNHNHCHTYKLFGRKKICSTIFFFSWSKRKFKFKLFFFIYFTMCITIEEYSQRFFFLLTGVYSLIIVFILRTRFSWLYWGYLMWTKQSKSCLH